jgi:hypothetical protein
MISYFLPAGGTMLGNEVAGATPPALTSTSCTSNTNTEFEGIAGGLPCKP